MHTPGKWYCTETYSYVLNDVKRTTVAAVSGQSLAEKAYNALLIAAAPDLLEACKLALRNEESRLYMLPVDGPGVSEQKDILSAAIGILKAAVQKAEGRS